jgi:hypothetical protein
VVAQTFAQLRASGRVIIRDRRKITGAAATTTGSMTTQANTQDRSQCAKNPPTHMKFKLAMAEAIELVSADCMAAKKKCA